ncbi:hypothetical protein BASA81_000977 [Batrachochytrium salamandrivorans]|nr:hypothetical protein BASA81_000977 [Batrachochytrium salamandrivorans]
MGNVVKKVVRVVDDIVSDIKDMISVLGYMFGQKPARDNRSMAPEAQRSNKTREQLVQEARDSLPGFDPDKHNIAVCGPAGSGKSSLVNALQGVRDGDPGAASVGEIECTDNIKRYPVSGSHLVVWDLPGCGTDRHPFEGYFDAKKLYAFDILLLVYKDRLNAHAANLYRECMERQVSVAVVRTHADAALQAKLRRGMTVEAAQAEMRSEFQRELRLVGIDNFENAFYVSSWDLADRQSNMDEHRFIGMLLRYGSQRAEVGWDAREFIRRFYAFADNA